MGIMRSVSGFEGVAGLWNRADATPVAISNIEGLIQITLGGRIAAGADHFRIAVIEKHPVIQFLPQY